MTEDDIKRLNELIEAGSRERNAAIYHESEARSHTRIAERHRESADRIERDISKLLSLYVGLPVTELAAALVRGSK
ncbi:TPA: hypothetical protein QDB21_005636 [Burkholderia vietnamiensis]|nr:hypothetical protein [Burkholderia vietnamiensis]